MSLIRIRVRCVALSSQEIHLPQAPAKPGEPGAGPVVLATATLAPVPPAAAPLNAALWPRESPAAQLQLNRVLAEALGDLRVGQECTLTIDTQVHEPS